MPASRSRIARNALFTSRVKIEDERPYLIPFETRIASSTSRTRISAVVGVVLPTGTESHLLGHRDELRLQRVVGTLLHDHTRRGGEALARRPERRPDDPVDGELEVGVVEDDDRVLAAELEMDVLEAVGGIAHHLHPGLARPRERDHAHVGMLDEAVADRAADAGQNVVPP